MQFLEHSVKKSNSCTLMYTKNTKKKFHFRKVLIFIAYAICGLNPFRSKYTFTAVHPQFSVSRNCCVASMKKITQQLQQKTNRTLTVTKVDRFRRARRIAFTRSSAAEARQRSISVCTVCIYASM